MEKLTGSRNDEVNVVFHSKTRIESHSSEEKKDEVGDLVESDTEREDHSVGDMSLSQADASLNSIKLRMEHDS